MITVTYSVALEDFINAQRLHRARLSWWRRSLRWLISVWVLLVFCAGLASWVTTNGLRFNAHILPVLVVCLGWLLAVWMLPKYSWRKTFEKDQRLHQEVTIRISGEGIHFVTPNSDARAGWGLFTRYLESDKIFVLYQSNQIMNVIPKRFFGSGEVQQFHELLREKVSGK